MNYCVYSIKCDVNGRVYIGQTKNLKNREIDHFYRLSRNIHDNPNLQIDYNLYGRSHFSVNIVETCDTRQQAKQREDYWIKYYGDIESSCNYNCKNNYFNNTQMKSKVSHTASISPNYGNKGKKLSEETKRKIGEANKGREVTLETKQKLRDAAKRRDIIPWNKGKKGLYVPSEETRRKISESNKGKTFTPEHKANISKSRKGKASHIKYTPQLALTLQEEYRKYVTMYDDISIYKKLSKEYNIKYIVCRNLILYGKAYPSEKDKLRCNDYPVKEYNSSELEAESNLK